MSESQEASVNASPAQRAMGYRKKPMWIYLTSFALMLSPIGNLLWSLMSMQVPGWYKPSVWMYWARFVKPETWALLGLLFLAGFFLLFVRRWTWTFSLGVLGLITIYDLVMIKHFMALGPAAVIAMILGTISFGLIMYTSEFRKPYTEPRLRWWETSPRYKVDLPASCSKIDQPATLVDISRSGLLLEWPANFKVPDIEGDCEISLPTQSGFPARIMRKSGNGYGLSFATMDRSKKRALLEFIDTLATNPTKLTR